MELGTMIPSRRRYESAASDFDTPDVPVEKYEYQAEDKMSLNVTSLLTDVMAFERYYFNDQHKRILAEMETRNLNGYGKRETNKPNSKIHGEYPVTEVAIGVYHV
ncbi:hypothetical protein Tco_0645499 [Tanacetum coccineum]